MMASELNWQGSIFYIYCAFNVPTVDLWLKASLYSVNVTTFPLTTCDYPFFPPHHQSVAAVNLLKRKNKLQVRVVLRHCHQGVLEGGTSGILGTDIYRRKTWATIQTKSGIAAITLLGEYRRLVCPVSGSRLRNNNFSITSSPSGHYFPKVWELCTDYFSHHQQPNVTASRWNS